MNYLATFHTHLSALLTSEAILNAGGKARMSPVPRSLSASCGTCVRYETETDCRELLDHDFEALYKVVDKGEYILLLENE